jgi:hypothetical protein
MPVPIRRAFGHPICLVTFSVASTVLVLSARTAGATTYTAVDMNPAGFEESVFLSIDGGKQVGWGRSPTFNAPHALLWNGTANDYVDLHAGDIPNSIASFVRNGQQVGNVIGYGVMGFGDRQRAILWTGTAASYVDLTPAGFTDGKADAVGGGQQVGSVWNGDFGPSHAALWTGSRDSFVDLRTGAEALAVSAGRQGGSGFVGTSRHALLWFGTAASVVDLNPAPFTQSMVFGMDDLQAVGMGSGPSTGGEDHALLWTGNTAASFVDLHPSRFTRSAAASVRGGFQVGSANGPDNLNHAIVWSGTADSAVDLNAFLPPGFVSAVASDVDTDGTVVGWAGDANFNFHAMMWIPAAPEPVGPVVMFMGATAVIFRRRHVTPNRTASLATRLPGPGCRSAPTDGATLWPSA